MESAKCALCLNKCTPGIKIAENVVNSKGVDTLTRGEEDSPIRNQLQILLLLRKILEVPQEKCCDFLREYGDPGSWINCCDSCSTLVGKCRIIVDQIMKLQKQFEHLQKEIKNIIIRSAKSEEAKDEFHWGRGVQREMRSFITKEFYNAIQIKEEFVEDISLPKISVSESIIGHFPEEMRYSNQEQNPVVAVENECSTYPTNSLLYEADYCDSKEQYLFQGMDKVDYADNQDIQNAKVMSEGGYLQSKTTTLDTPFISHLTEYLPENTISISCDPSMYTEDKTFQCNICRERFTELGNLHDHFCSPTEIKPFINGSFSASSIHSEENCYICIQGFNDPKDLNDHIISTQVTNNLIDKQCNCDICGRCFSNYSSLQKHGEIHSGKQCNICEKYFLNFKDFSVHMESHTEDGSSKTEHKCDFCGKCFREKKNLINHRRSHTGDKPLGCKYCKKSFNYTSDLKTHERIHTGEKPYKCGLCEKTFSQSSHLKDHGRIHTGEKPHKCQFCEKSFSHFKSLRDHERIHTGEKPFKCRLCEKSFSLSLSLKRHERIHTEEKPYKCQFCEKGFTQSINLKKHERIHTGEKPYKCRFCDKSFTQATSLKTHERTHTGEKPYKCKFCEKCFVQIAGLNDHEAIHTGDKPFKCQFCEKSFLRSNVLIKHEAIVHLEKP